MIEVHKENEIKKHMLTKGYEQYLWDVVSLGGKCWFTYRKDDIRIDEDKSYKFYNFRNSGKKKRPMM